MTGRTRSPSSIGVLACGSMRGLETHDGPRSILRVNGAVRAGHSLGEYSRGYPRPGHSRLPIPRGSCRFCAGSRMKRRASVGTGAMEAMLAALRTLETSGGGFAAKPRRRAPSAARRRNDNGWRNRWLFSGDQGGPSPNARWRIRQGGQKKRGGGAAMMLPVSLLSTGALMRPQADAMAAGAGRA